MKTIFTLVSILICSFSFSQWTRVEDLPATDIVGLYSNDTVIYAGGRNVIYVSHDKGQSWASINVLPLFGQVDNIILYENEIYVSSFSQGVASSSDAGKTWRDITNGLFPAVSDFCEFNGELFASTLGGSIYKLNPASRNSWLPFSNGLSSLSANANSMASTRHALVAGTLANGLYDYLSENATTWEERFLLGQISASEGVYDIINVHDSLFLSGFTGKMYLSTDNGLTWTVFGDRLSSNNLTMVNAKQALILSRVIFDGIQNNTAFYYIKKDALDKQFINFSFVPGHFTYRMQIHGDKLWDASTNGLFYMPLSLLPGITADDPITPVILPVQFVLFSAICATNMVELTWKTASEQNSDRFNIEKSNDGSNWVKIGSLPAAGTSVTERSYSFTDLQPSNNSFYRIAEVDLDNKVHYSEVLRSSCNTTAGTFEAWPNPVYSTVFVNIVSETPSPISIRIFDSKGALVKRKEAELMQGTNRLNVDMSTLPGGVYTMAVYWKNNGTNKTIRLIKQ